MKLDIYELMEEQERLKKDLFDMVYNWGRWDVKADYQVPAFKMTMDKLIEYIKGDIYE